MGLRTTYTRFSHAYVLRLYGNLRVMALTRDYFCQNRYAINRTVSANLTPFIHVSYTLGQCRDISQTAVGCEFESLQFRIKQDKESNNKTKIGHGSSS